MTRTVFLDTGYPIALLRKNDARHLDALEAAERFSGRFITSDLVLVEFANSLSAPPHRAVVASTIEEISTDTSTLVAQFSRDGMEKASALFKSRHDKSWGLVDCFSFIVMKENRIRQALTFDDHFRQAGFETPLLGNR